MLQVYEKVPYQEVIEYEYEILCQRFNSKTSDYAVPFIGELHRASWETIDMNETDNAIGEAIHRGDHEILGVSKLEFSNLARNNSIPGIFQYEVPYKEVVQRAVAAYLRKQHVSYTDYYDVVINSHIGRGVW